MVQPERPIHLDIVTTAPDRANAYAELIGVDKVSRIDPLFTEGTLHKSYRAVHFEPQEFPMQTAERKALQDLAALVVLSTVNHRVENGHAGDISMDGKRVIRIYSDTVNIAYTGDLTDDSAVILEKPRNMEEWLADYEYGAMALSGKNTEVCTALTAIDMTDPTVHPKTILIRTAAKMRPYTMEDVRAFIDRHGEEKILRAASGISFMNETVELFDTSQPLRIYVQTHPDLQPRLLREYPTWDHLTREDRRKILYGAVPEALDTLITDFTPAYSPSMRNGNGKGNGHYHTAAPQQV